MTRVGVTKARRYPTSAPAYLSLIASVLWVVGSAETTSGGSLYAVCRKLSENFATDRRGKELAFPSCQVKMKLMELALQQDSMSDHEKNVLSTRNQWIAISGPFQYFIHDVVATHPRLEIFVRIPPTVEDPLGKQTCKGDTAQKGDGTDQPLACLHKSTKRSGGQSHWPYNLRLLTDFSFYSTKKVSPLYMMDDVDFTPKKT